MGWWMAGAALAVLTMWSVWDAGRPGRASRAALGLMRAVGGLGLLVIGAHAVDAGAGAVALIAAGPALALIVGMFSGIRAPRAERQAVVPAPREDAPPERAATGEPAPRHGERRAA